MLNSLLDPISGAGVSTGVRCLLLSFRLASTQVSHPGSASPNAKWNLAGLTGYFRNLWMIRRFPVSVPTAYNSACETPRTPGQKTQHRSNVMANTFGSDILIQAPDPEKAGRFYVEQLGFEITDPNPRMIALHGEHINLFIEPGPTLGPVMEVTVDNVEKAKAHLAKNGCEIVKDEPGWPRTYVKDPYGLIFNLSSK
jgi:predicted enzyme related to lactoylglutathione lyase